MFEIKKLCNYCVHDNKELEKESLSKLEEIMNELYTYDGEFRKIEEEDK